MVMQAKKIQDLSKKINESNISTLYELTVLARVASKQGSTVTEILGSTSAKSDDQRKKHQRFSGVARRLAAKGTKGNAPLLRLAKSKSSGASGPDSPALFLTASGQKALLKFKLPKNPKELVELSETLDNSCINSIFELSTLIIVAKNSGNPISKLIDGDTASLYQRFKNTTVRLSGVTSKSPGKSLPKLIAVKDLKQWTGDGRLGHVLNITSRGKKELAKFGL